jgi:Zn-dependent protease
MSLSWKIGRVAGIDLYLHSTFLLFLVFVGASQGGVEAVLLVSAVFGCVLLHELGHALAAQFCGIRTQDITLYPIGGVARLDRMPRKPASELLITLAGPAVNVAIAATLALLLAITGTWDSGSVPTMAGSFFRALMWINVVLAVFNMIPAFPMDGGRVLRALLSGWIGRLRATEVAANIGQFLALAFGIYNLFHFDLTHLVRVFIAAFIYMAAGAERDRVRMEERRPQRWNPDGIWTAPQGYHWVSGADGAWRLAPIWVVVDDQAMRP